MKKRDEQEIYAFQVALINWLESQNADPAISAEAMIGVIAAMMVDASKDKEDLAEGMLACTNSLVRRTSLSWAKKMT